MKTLKELRLKMGLTQVEMATLLLVSAQLVSMAECGLRDLKPAVTIRLNYLREQFEQTPDPNQEDMRALIIEERNKVCAKIEKEIADLEMQRLRLERKIDNMITEYNRVQHTLAVLRNEMRLFSGVQNYFSVVQKLYDEHLEIFRENHPIHQQILQDRALQLNEKIVHLNNQLAAINTFFNA